MTAKRLDYSTYIRSGIQMPITIMITFSVSETEPSGALESRPAQALSSRLSM